MKLNLALFALSFASLYGQTPNITAVQDGGAYTSNVAQGSVFVVKGTNLSPEGYTAAAAPTYPFDLDGISITFSGVSGGAANRAYIVYLYAQGGVNQLAGVLPSTVPPGAYDVRVARGSLTSNPFRTQVVARKPGIVTADGSGSGPAQATLSGGLILARNSNVGAIGQFSTRAARPGERVDLWGTGLGPDSAADTGGGTSGDQTSAGAIRVLVNGAEVVPAYAGRSLGFPGLDQIVFTIPTSITPSCTVSIQVRAGGALSNQTSIPVAASGEQCAGSNPNPGNSTPFNLTASQIQDIISRGTFILGQWTQARTVGHVIDFNTGAPPTVEGSDTVSVDFLKYSGDLRPFAQPATDFALPRDGACFVFDSQTVPAIPASLGFTVQALDAGASLNLQGPSGTRTLPKQLMSFSYAAEFKPAGSYLNAGSYTLSGSGGPGVSAFSASMTMPGELVWTNRTTLQNVTRANGVTVTWTGGQGANFIQIMGLSMGVNLSAPGQMGLFNCYANPSAGSFTVPASVLNRLPASGDMGIPGLPFIYPGLLSVSTATISYGGAANVDVLMKTSVSGVSQSTLFK